MSRSAAAESARAPRNIILLKIRQGLWITTLALVIGLGAAGFLVPLSPIDS